MPSLFSVFKKLSLERGIGSFAPFETKASPVLVTSPRIKRCKSNRSRSSFSNSSFFLSASLKAAVELDLILFDSFLPKIFNFLLFLII